MIKNERIGRLTDMFESEDGTVTAIIDVQEKCFDNNGEPYFSNYKLAVDTRNKEFKKFLDETPLETWVVFGFYVQSYAKKGRNAAGFITKLKLRSIEEIENAIDRVMLHDKVHANYKNVLYHTLNNN